MKQAHLDIIHVFEHNGNPWMTACEVSKSWFQTPGVAPCGVINTRISDLSEVEQDSGIPRLRNDTGYVLTWRWRKGKNCKEYQVRQAKETPVCTQEIDLKEAKQTSLLELV